MDQPRRPAATALTRKPSPHSPGDEVKPLPREQAGPDVGQETCMLSVVVPVYNEEGSLRELHRQIVAVLQQLDLDSEIIFVDDGSRDGSYAILRELSGGHRDTRALRLAANAGKAAALNAGFRHARGDVLITMDADLQDDPAEIPRFLAKIDEGYDLVSGWKAVRHDPWHKTLPSRLFNRVVRWTCRLPLHDVNCGFKAYARSAFANLSLYGELHRFVPVIAANAGARVAEIEVRHRPRQHGRSKYGLERLPKGFLDLLTVLLTTRFLKRPMHFFGWIGLASMGVGGSMLGYLAVLWLLGHRPIGNRPLLLYGVLLAIMGVQMLSVGLLAELINRFNHDKEMPWIQERLGFEEPGGGRTERPVG